MIVDPKSNETADPEKWLLYNSALASALQYAADVVTSRRDNFSRNRYFEHDILKQATKTCADPAKDFVFPAYAADDFIPEFHKNELSYFSSAGHVGTTSRAVFRRTIERMKTDAKAGQAELLFMITPSRRLVAASFLAANAPNFERPDWIVTLVEAEAALVAMMKQELEALDLPVTDALPLATLSYERTVKSGRPYYPCFDGHPLENGYAALAEAAANLYRIHGPNN